MIPEAGTAVTLCVSIVLHESNLHSLRATLGSLRLAVDRSLSDGVAHRVRILVFDNASSPAYRQALAPIRDEASAMAGDAVSFEFCACESNDGFGAGHNRALADQDSDVFLVLNPDVELAEDALSEALSYLAGQPGAVALNPLCRRPDGSREYLCKRYPAVFDLLLRGFGNRALQDRFAARLSRYEYRDLPVDEAASVVLLSGACLLLRRTVFERCGGFDPRYFMYFEDFDLALRLRDCGELVQLPAMRVVHHGGFAARKGWRHIRWFIRSALRFYHRHGWRWL